MTRKDAIALVAKQAEEARRRAGNFHAGARRQSPEYAAEAALVGYLSAFAPGLELPAGMRSAWIERQAHDLANLIGAPFLRDEFRRDPLGWIRDSIQSVGKSAIAEFREEAPPDRVVVQKTPGVGISEIAVAEPPLVAPPPDGAGEEDLEEDGSGGGDEEEGPGTTPRARELAVAYDVDLALVEGTGLGGRVTAADVQRYVESSAGA